MRRIRSRARGFTLIELSIVVVIVGVLAVLGTMAYRRHRASARVGEATTMLNAIRTAQNEYKAETNGYADVSKTFVDDLYPAKTPGTFATQWGGDCTGCKGGIHGWERLKVRSPDPLYFGYSTVAGTSPTDVAYGGGSNDVQAALDQQKGVVKTGEPWFAALARADLDGDGTYCDVLALSHTNRLTTFNEGE